MRIIKPTKVPDKISKRLNKHKGSKTIMKTVDGFEVIGQEVDDTNRLIYVLKKGNEITMDYAENHRVNEIVNKVVTVEKTIFRS